MNGPQHYREAEKILDLAEESHLDYGNEWYANAVGAAQVHATLALAAATAAPAVKDWLGDESRLGRDWTEVI